MLWPRLFHRALKQSKVLFRYWQLAAVPCDGHSYLEQIPQHRNYISYSGGPRYDLDQTASTPSLLAETWKPTCINPSSLPFHFDLICAEAWARSFRSFRISDKFCQATHTSISRLLHIIRVTTSLDRPRF
jgi:hypothetical protein